VQYLSDMSDAIARRVLELGAGAGADRLSTATGLLTVSEVARDST
jgi:hypothetical protein